MLDYQSAAFFRSELLYLQQQPTASRHYFQSEIADLFRGRVVESIHLCHRENGHVPLVYYLVKKRFGIGKHR